MDFAAQRERADLETDRMLRYAITRAMEIVGEASNQLSPEIREQMPSIQWPGIVSMRNRLAHAYFAVNLNILWEGVLRDIPELLREVARVLAADPDSSTDA